MLRFYHTNLENDNIAIDENPQLMDNSIWHNCRSYLQKSGQKQSHIINLIPVKNTDGELVAYGYQDEEANRELRMLRELWENAQALQFTDIFPEYQEVLIWGCNELAIRFAEYLERLGIVVAVAGQYWDLLGYENCDQQNLLGKDNRLVVYAEGIPLQNHSLYETVIRSASSEFECIDKIYEANVLEGRIRDTIGDLSEFINRLKDEREIVILGADRKAQDTYDLLMSYGIDICCFAVDEKRDEMRLGKKIMSIEEAMRSFERPVFLNHTDVHGALGEKWTEYFDYRGYERNKQFFLVRDYTDIPTSNLIHILHGKNVLLTGDSRLCQLLSDYLNLIENGEVTVQYTALDEKVSVKEGDILCLVVPDYISNKVMQENKETELRQILRQRLSEMGFVGYTEYFVCNRCFALIDLYLNKDIGKYTVMELMPKGILLGRIPGYSGNVFFRGIMDGHPEVVSLDWDSDFNNNLFYYCIRLANVASDKVMPIFWEMFDAESGSMAISFVSAEIFEARAKSLLSLKESFTSQELFVLFHIAYIEMINSRPISDISKLVIYWEPHVVERNEFPFFALWLEDQKVNGNTILLCRNNMVKLGSLYKGSYRFIKKHHIPSMSKQTALESMFLSESRWDAENVEYQCWTEYRMRFEDIKTRPEEKLTEVCNILGIAWSDSMLQTTICGKPMSPSDGSIDFDLKAVFNKYEDFFSEFDRLRISIASSSYQKRYGYTYDNCLKFSRRELQEMFFKPFLFDEKSLFGESENDNVLFEWINWQLWNVRKHMVLNDVCAEFDRFELVTNGKKRMDEFKKRMDKCNQEEMRKSIEYIKNHDQLILYGTGNDCKGLLKLIDGDTKKRLLYSDKKAVTTAYIFQDKNVIVPKELCSVYGDYNILVTSSLYRRNIEYEFEYMGIDPSRVYYNRAEFKKEDNK